MDSILKTNRRGAWLALACLAAAAAPAAAESNPYYFGGSLGLSQVSNVYRQAFSSNSDTVASASLLGGFDQRLGRQRLYADASVQGNRYNDNKQLDNHAYSLKGGLDWSTIERLSGSFTFNSSEALADYNVGRGVDQVFKKNIERNDNAQALFRVGLVTRYSAEAIISYRKRDFSAPEYDQLDYHQTAGSLGLVYRPSQDLRLGVAYRQTDGVYPHYPLFFGGVQIASFQDDYKRKDIDLTTGWDASGASKLNARISYTKTEHTVITSSNYSGFTGLINWNWQPTGHWTFFTQLSRETGQEGLPGVTDQSRLTTALRLNGTYQLTGKVSLNAGLFYSRADRNSTAFQSRDFDRDFAYNLGANWAYSRTWSVSCLLNHLDRDSSIPQYAFDTGSFGCNVQAVFY
ncbi:hypothetical protein [Roseateles violae]|uniref:Beta-barrel porin 2 n=1 Tax=Roseateles violae TaxID=3058042 RepID=A0ABT8DR70_9BURK|nr:hypothetical protein [Pelomonas sp. PFR6]MDN3920840.1 hypothetical protein [Pelomonas sp. PFR6]